MNIDELEDSFPEYEDQVEHVETVSEQRARAVSPEEVVGEELAQSIPFPSIYSHQAKGLNALADGDDICVTTPTSSGKTLIYALDIARKAKRNSDSTALLVYPTKALSRDQKESLDEIYDELGFEIDIGVYDGDSDRDEKRRIRRESDIIITNFQGLNYYLPHHSKWTRIFRNLETIVVDEAHSYTGIEGMHVAWIFRRLRRIAENVYGANPQIVLSSATIGNPEQHSLNLTGREVTVIDEDGSPRGSRDILLWNPPSYIDDSGTLSRRSAHRESSDILAHLTANETQTLMFAPSRKMTELCARWTESTLNDDYVDQDRYIEPYNAGHRKKERRDVEDALKESKADGVVSTTALELGIDIGSVDATLMDGYPGRKASFWQQAGRSGRGRSDALSVLVARHDSIDQYILENPDFLLDGDVENAVIDLSNRAVLKRHVLAAANESELTSADRLMFGFTRFTESIDDLRTQGLLSGELSDGVRYTGSSRPEAEIDLYATSDTQFSVTVDLGHDSFTLPDVDASRAYRELHPNAIHLHKGQQYKVVDFDRDRREITLEKVNVGYYTQSNRQVEVTDLSETKSYNVDESVTVKRGTATIEETYRTYNKVYFSDGTQDDFLPTGLNEPIKLETDLMWIEFDDKEAHTITAEAAVDGLAGSLHAAEHGLIKMSPTVITADSDDLGGLSIPDHPETGKATVFIYDGVEGGVGFSHAIYDELETLAERTKEQLSTCDCPSDHGCPACTMSPMCGDNNEPMDSVGAQYILQKLAEQDNE